MGILDKFTNFLVMKDDEDLMDEEIIEETPVRKEKRISPEKERIENLRPERKVYRRNQESAREIPSEPVREKRAERTNKIVPIRSSANGVEVCLTKPVSFEDSQDVCDLLLENKAVIVNLEGFDTEVAQRIMDFLSGVIYAIQGDIHGISQYIFILSPNGIDISGDYMDVVNRFDVPNLIKDF